MSCAHHVRRQPLAQLGHAERFGAPESSCRPAGGDGQQRQPLRPGPARLAEHGAHKGRHWRAAAQAQALAIGVLQRQRHATQQRRHIGTDVSHQLERGLVGADEDVLPVVQRIGRRLARCARVRQAEAPSRRPPPRGRHGVHARRRRCRPSPRRPRQYSATGRQGTAVRVSRLGVGADHTAGRQTRWRTQRPRQFVRQAIHSLRSGVSEVRWCSTRKPSASISRSSVR